MSRLSLFKKDNNVPAYASVLGWTWDQKERSLSEVARRVKGNWVFTARSFMVLGMKPEGAEFISRGALMKGRTHWNLKLGGTYPLPDGCVKPFTVGGDVYDVMHIVSFIQMEIDWGVRHVPGFFGYNPVTTDAVFFGISPDDPMINEFDHVVMHIDDMKSKLPASSPSYGVSVVYDAFREQNMEKEQKLLEARAHHEEVEKVIGKLQQYNAEDFDELEEFQALNELSHEAYLKVKEAEKDQFPETPVERDMYADVPERTPAVERRKVLKMINGVGVESLEDYTAEEVAHLDKTRALAEFRERQKKAVSGLTFDEIDGVTMLNLSHLMQVKKVEVKENVPILKIYKESEKDEEKSKS